MSQPKTVRKPTRFQVLDVLYEQIDCEERSYREADGIVRDPAALHRIACLREAVAVVIESYAFYPWPQPRQRNRAK